VATVTGIAEVLSQHARELQEKTWLSDHGMAMDAEDIPAGAEQDPRHDSVPTPAHHED
jgi:hypothetical protein